MTIKGTVHSTSEAYDVMSENWTLPVALMGGEKAMKTSGREYLPQEPMEDDAQYNNRVERSTLKNYFAWAVENHTGRVFSKPIVLSEDTPVEVVEYNRNLDFMGSNTNNFYRSVFKDMLVKGISYVYVDYPRGAKDLTLAEELEAGLRPYCLHIKAEQLIKAVPAIVNGRVVLARAHILENVEVPNGEWETRTIQQVRVLYPGYWEVWQMNSDNNWVSVDSGETSLTYIPLVPLYGNKVGFFNGTSPLQNLAYLNRAHWQSLSDQMNITHVARVPILFGTGFDNEDSLTIGAKVSILGPEGSDLKYVEHTGKAIESGMAELKDLEERMLLESLELVNGGGDTATGKSLDVSDANCSLQDLSLRLQDMITKVNYILCDWDGLERKGSALVNTDFGLHLRDGSEANVLLKMRQNKSISIETFHREMKRRGLLSPDFNSEEDIKLLKVEVASAPQPYVDESGKQIVGDGKEIDLDTGKPRIE